MSVRRCVLSSLARRMVTVSLASVFAVASLFVLTDCVVAQERENTRSKTDGRADDASASARANEKALRYFQVLQRRPRPGYLFDRFYNAWLDTDSIAGLERFLSATVEKDETTPNRLLLAFFYAKQGQNVRALEQFRAALNKDPGSAEAWYHKALVEQRTLDFDTAIEDLRRALDAEPSADLERDILQLQGRLYARSGDASAAARVWSLLLEKNPRDEELQEDLIELQISEGLFDVALATAESLVEMTKDPYLSVVRRLRIGDIHQLAGARDKALAAYASSLERVGSDTWLEREILRQIAQVFRREDDIIGLKAYFGKLLEVHTKRIGLRRQYSETLAELGEKKAANKAFLEVLQLTPGDRSIREDYVDMLSRLELRSEAIEQLQLLVNQYPDDGELLIKLAKLQHENDDSGAAKTTLERYLETSDGSEYSYLRAAQLMEQFQRQEAADAVFRELLAKFPESEGARDAHAAYLHRQGRKDEAIDVWRGLAHGADRERLVRVARALSSRSELVAAFEILSARFGDFGNDPIYLSQLCTVAIGLKKFDAALPWARQLVVLAQKPLDVENAVDRAARIVQRTEKEVELTQALAPSELPQEICLLAELHERAGDSRSAEAALARLDLSAPVLATTQRIRLFRQRGEFEKAAREAARLVRLPGGRRAANVQKVVDLFGRAHNLNEALEWIPEWKKLIPGSTVPWLTEARLHLAEGRNHAAVDVLRRAVQAFSGDAQLRATLAAAYADDGKLADAERLYVQLYEEAPNASEKIRWVQELARAAELRGATESLVEQFEERRRSNRTSIVPLLALAEIHRVGDDYEGRRRALLEAARIRPQDLDLLLEIARVEEAEQEFDRALATLATAAKLAKGKERDRIRERVARLHFAAGDEDEGFQVLQEIARGDDIDAQAVENLAQAIFETGDWSRAADFLRPFVDKFSKHYGIGYLYAVALAENERELDAARVFSSLLRVDEEPPRLSTTVQSHHALQEIESQLRVLPPAALELVSLQTASRFALRHRQMSRQYFGPLGFSQTAVEVPRDLRSLRSYCLAYLSAIGQELEGDDLAEVKADLVSAGVSYADYFFDLDFNSLQDGGGIAALLEKHPRSEALLSVALIFQATGQGVMAIDQLRVAVETFEREWPELAYLGALGASFSLDENVPEELSEKALKLVDSIDKPGVVTWVSTLMAVGGATFGRDVVGALDDNDKKILTRKLVEWYPKVNIQSLPIQWVFLSVASAVASSEGTEAFLHFLDREVRERISTRSRKPSQVAMFFGGQTGSELLAPLEFPPQVLTDFPTVVLTALSSDRSGFAVQLFGDGLELDDDEVRKYIAELKSPILRVLLFHRVDEIDKAKAEIAALISAEEPRVDSFLLAAAHSARVEDDMLSAIEYLERARFLPMTRETRRRIDGSIVAWSVDRLTGEPAKDEEIKTAGREAVLRLRRASLTAEQRDELVAAMEQLELTKEAEKLQDRIASAVNQLFSFPSGGGANPQSPERLQKLLVSGDRDRALKLLGADLKRFASKGLHVQTAFDESYELEEWLRPIAVYNLGEDLLSLVDPGTAENPRRWAQYGFACEVLGKRERAIEMYKQVARERPKEMGVRVRLVALLLETHPEAAVGPLRELDAMGLAAVGQHATGMVDEEQIPYADRLRLVETIVDAVAQLEDTSNVPLFWVPHLLDRLVRSSDADGVEIGSLYAASRASAPSEAATPLRDQIASFQKQRREIHDKVCNVMLGVPSLASDGFRRLSGFLSLEGREEEAFQLAKTAILAQAESSPGPVNPITFLSFGLFESNSESIQMWGPEQFVARYAWKKQDRSLIERDIVQVVEKQKGRARKALVVDLRDRTELFFTAPEEFLERARKHCKKRRSGPFGPMLSAGALQQVLDVWELRELDVEIAPLIVGELTKTQDRGFTDSFSFLHRFVLAQYRRGGAKATTAVLERIAEGYLGPKEQRAARIEKHYDPNDYSIGTPNASIQAYLQILERLGQDHRLFASVYRHSEEQIEPFLGGRLVEITPEAHPLLEPETFKDFDRTTRLLTDSFFLGGSDDVRFYRIHGDDFIDSMFFQIGYQMRRSGGDLKEKYLAFLDTEKTLGRALLGAIAGDEPERWSGFLTEFRDELRALAPTPRAMFAKHAREDFARFVDVSKLTAEARAILEWAETLDDTSRQGKIDALLAAKSVRELKIEPHEFEDHFVEYLSDLLPQESERALKVFWKIAELVEKSGRDRRSRFYSADWSISSQLLQSLLSSEGSPATLSFVYDVLTTPEPPTKVEAPSNRVFEFSLQQLVSDARGDQQPRLDDRAALKRAMERLAGALAAKHYRLAAAPFFGFLTALVGSDQGRIQALLPLLREEMQRDAYPSLAKELYVVAALRGRNSSSDEAASQGAHLGDENRHVLALLDDQEVPTNLRLRVAAAFLAYSGDVLPLAVTARAIDLLVAAWDQKMSVSADDVRRAARGLIHHARQRDGAWDAAAANLVQAWKKNVLRGEASRRHSSFDVGYQSRSVVLQLCILLGDDASMNQILEKSDGEPGAEWMLLLIRSGSAEQVTRVLMRRWKQFDWRGFNRDRELYLYDEEIERKVPAILERLENPDMKLFFEAFVASLPDPSAPGADVTPREVGSTKPSHTQSRDAESSRLTPRDERLLRLGERIRQHQFQNISLRDAVLSFVTESRPAAAKLYDEIKTAAAGVTPLMFAQDQFENQSGFDSTQTKTLFETYFRLSLQRGPQVASETLAAISKIQMRQPYLRQMALAQFLGMFHDAFREDVATWTPQVRSENVGFWSEFISIEKPYQALEEELFSLAGIGFLYSYFEGDGTAKVYEAAFSQLDAPTLSRFEQNVEFFEAALREVPHAMRNRSIPRERRVATAVALLSHPVVVASIERHEEYRVRAFQRLLKSQLLSTSELLEIGPELIQASPRGGFAAGELASYQESAKQFEAAIGSYDEGIRQVPPASRGRYSQFHIAKAKLLKQLQRPKEALSALEEMDIERLSDSLASEFKNLHLELELATKVVTSDELDIVQMLASGFAAGEQSDGGRIAAIGVAFQALGEHCATQQKHEKAAAYLYLAAKTFQKVDAEKKGSVGERLGAIARDLAISQAALARIKKPMEIVTPGAAWRYFDTGADLGSAWRTLEFDDSGWRQGFGKFGYGDGNEATTIDFGGDPRRKYITTYFRKEIGVDDPEEIETVTVDVLRDDGVVVYINGRELFRDNIAEGAVTARTLAVETIDRRDENRFYKHENLEVSEMILAGRNVIAVELHQRHPASSDCGFDMFVRANVVSLEELLKGVPVDSLPATLGDDVWNAIPTAIRPAVRKAPQAGLPAASDGAKKTSNEERGAPAEKAGGR